MATPKLTKPTKRKTKFKSGCRPPLPTSKPRHDAATSSHALSVAPAFAGVTECVPVVVSSEDKTCPVVCYVELTDEVAYTLSTIARCVARLQLAERARLRGTVIGPQVQAAQWSDVCILNAAVHNFRKFLTPETANPAPQKRVLYTRPFVMPTGVVVPSDVSQASMGANAKFWVAAPRV